MSTASTQRFSDRVANYIKYRPGYPMQVINFLKKQTELPEGSTVADIGAGTGIFTKLLLDAGFKVLAVEPNQPMRDAADEQLGANSNYTSVNGSAEATGLEDNSADLIVCAQAFHWFNTPATKAEFKRILKKNGYVALIWNNRDVDSDDLSIAYELLLKTEASDYNEVNHQNLKETDFAAFYREGKYTLHKFPNSQLFDEDGLIGRAFSSSYVPAQDTAAGHTFGDKLKEIFSEHQKNGKVAFRYQTEVYLGKI